MENVYYVAIAYDKNRSYTLVLDSEGEIVTENKDLVGLAEKFVNRLKSLDPKGLNYKLPLSVLRRGIVNGYTRLDELEELNPNAQKFFTRDLERVLNEERMKLESKENVKLLITNGTRDII
jgi:predicted S18 family serine protease